MVVSRTFGSIKFSSGDWVFEDIEPHVMIKIKSVFPKIPKTQTSPFQMRHSKEAAADIDWFMQRYPLQITPQDKEFLLREKHEHLAILSDLETLFKPDFKPPVLNLKKPLRFYQSQAVELFMKVKRLLVGDVVGLGKTPIGIGALLSEKTTPALIVVQTHLQEQWYEKCEEFSHLKVHVIKNGPVKQLPSADAYIVKYSQLAKWVDVFTQPDFIKCVVADEIQELRREDSLKYSAAKKIANVSEYFLGLSATPIYNYGDEIWNIINIVKPGFLDTKSNFLREWSQDYGRVITNPKALGSYLRENHVFLRRTREEVGLELPPVNRIVHTVEYDQKAIDKIQSLAKVLAIKVMEGNFIEKGQASRELDKMVRHATGVSKAKYVAEYVRMIVESGEPVLLAGWHRDVYDIWNRELANLKPVMYTGSESPAQKREAKRMFVEGESDIMMISLRSGIGLDGLQSRASIVVIGELDWSSEIHEQIIGRLRRDGQQNQVTVIFLISDSGSDPGIVDTLALKSSQSSGILDPFAGVQITDTDDTRIKNLAKMFLAKQQEKETQDGDEDN